MYPFANAHVAMTVFPAVRASSSARLTSSGPRPLPWWSAVISVCATIIFALAWRYSSQPDGSLSIHSSYRDRARLSRIENGGGSAFDAPVTDPVPRGTRDEDDELKSLLPTPSGDWFAMTPESLHSTP